MSFNNYTPTGLPYLPTFNTITAISKSNVVTNTPTIVTTLTPHNYSTGLVVRLDIALTDGMQQMNGLVGDIIVTGPSSFSIDIDSSQFLPFSLTDKVHKSSCSLVVPVGEINSILTQSTRNIL